MNIHEPAVATELLFNERLLTGLTIQPDEYYWSCLNIFECDKSELTYDDVKNLSADDIPENTFIYFPISIPNYTYCNTISLARSNGQLHFRFAISFNKELWDENLNLRGFFELLHDDIQQSTPFKVSDCYHDYFDYLLEVEFQGELTKNIDEQVQSALNEIKQYHDFNVKNVI
jgi:hypothetical protein